MLNFLEMTFLGVVAIGYLYVSYKDIKIFRIETTTVKWFFGLLLILTAIKTEGKTELILGSLAAAIGFYLLFRFLYLTKQLGGGDVRFATVLGLVHGYYGLEHSLFALFSITASVAIYGLIQRNKVFPYGPGMCIGSYLALITKIVPLPIG
ncbi:MAG: A24 family peptidase [Micrococcaceae bacterium]